MIRLVKTPVVPLYVQFQLVFDILYFFLNFVGESFGVYALNEYIIQLHKQWHLQPHNNPTQANSPYVLQLPQTNTAHIGPQLAQRVDNSKDDKQIDTQQVH